MAFSVPDIIQDYLEGGGTPVWFIEIEPNPGDSWSAKRYSQKAVNYEGNDFNDIAIKNIGYIGQGARLIKGGDRTDFSPVSIRLYNNEIESSGVYYKRQNEFINDSVIDRLTKIYLSFISTNRVENSSFEKAGSGTVFEGWTDSGTVSAETTNIFDSSTSAKFVHGSPVAKIVSNHDIISKPGETNTFSFYMRGDSVGGGEECEYQIEISGLYYNAATGNLQASAYWNAVSVTDPQTWERKSVEFNVYDFSISRSSAYDVVISVRSKTGTFYIDAIQYEGCKLSNYHHGKTDLDSDDVMLMFAAKISEQKWNHTEIQFTLRHFLNQYFKKIPKYTVAQFMEQELGYSADDYRLTKDSENSVIPITFGDFYFPVLGDIQYDEDNTLDHGYDDHRFRGHLAKCVLCNYDTTGSTPVRVYVDRHEFGQVTGEIHSMDFQLFNYNEASRDYCRQLYDDRTTPIHATLEFLHGSGASYEMEDHSYFKLSVHAHYIPQGLMPLAAFWVPTLLLDDGIQSGSDSLTNPEYLVDDDLSLGARYEPPTGNTGIVYAECRCDKLRVSGSKHVIDIYYLCKSDVGVTAECISSLQLDADELDWTGSYSNIARSAPAGGPEYWDNMDYGKNKKLTEISFVSDLGVSMPTNDVSRIISETHIIPKFHKVTTGSGAVLIYECGIMIWFTIDIDNVLLACSTEGRGISGTWNSRKSAGDMIRNPADAIEAILRDELDIGDDLINMDKFDDVFDARSQPDLYGSGLDYDIGGQVIEKTDAEKIIKKICQESLLLYFTDNEGKFAIKALNDITPIDTLEIDDFIDPLKNIKIRYTDSEYIYNDFYIKYHKSQMGDDHYARFKYCNKDGSNLVNNASYFEGICSDSYSTLGNVEKYYEVECDWIRYDTTAEYFIKLLIQWFAQRRLVVSGKVKLKHIDKEMGDVVKVVLPEYYIQSEMEEMVFVISEKRVNPADNTIKMEFVQVHNLDYI